MATVTQYVNGLRAASAVGLGILTGISIGTSTIALPAAYATLPSQQRLALWSRMFDLGKVQVPLLSLASCLSLAAAAYYARPIYHQGFVGAHRRELMAAATALALSSLPYTALVMLPGIKRLKTIEADENPASEPGLVNLEVDAGIVRWDYQHRVRAVLAFAAFALSVTELVSC